MAQHRDYYQILGVDHGATQAEVKRAFRRLARQHHPDVNPGDPEAADRFREIVEAYEVLGDPNRRAEYDLYGRADVSAPLAGDIWEELAGFGGLFDAFFGGRTARRARPRRGADLRYDLEVELGEVATGVQREIAVERVGSCSTCGGTGSKSRGGDRICPGCGGTGQRRHTTATPFGRMSTVSTCHQCEGRGRVVTDPCDECGGRGRRQTRESVSVEIPAGVEEGATLQLEGQGEAGELGARPGDLYVVVHVKEHEIFRRRGRDLHMELPISFVKAALGGTAEVPTLADGPEELQIPEGTQAGDTLALRGRGLPDLRTGVRGAQYVTVRVVTPTDLTSRQRELLAEFAREGGDQVDLAKGWLTRLREAMRGEEDE